MANHRVQPSVPVQILTLTTLLIAALLLGPVAVAWADTYTVDREDDNAGATACEIGVPGDCSLRGAVTAANLNPGTDRIVLRSGEYDLSLLGQEDANKQGDLDIRAAGGNLRIEGAGVDETFIRGGEWFYGGPVTGVDRVLHIDPDGTGGIRVEISGVSIQYGYGGSYGGGIYIEGDNLVEIADSAVMSNTVTIVGPTSGGGGGIYNGEGTLLLDNTLVMSNTAGAGVAGRVVVGGGIYIGDTATVTVTGSTVSGNEARAIVGTGSEAAGGGIGNVGGVAYIHSSTVSKNSATGGASGSLGLGGGLLNAAGGTMLVDRGAVVSDNEADLQGGGMANFDSTSVLENTTFSENRTTGGSGGEDSVGGALFNYIGHAQVVSSTIEGNEATTGAGGGIANSGGTVKLTDTFVRSNVSDGDCGGIRNENGSTLSMDGGTLQQNDSGAGGGGLCNLDSTATMTGTLVTLNVAEGSAGGILGFEDSLSLIECFVSGNWALDGSGGAIYEALGTLRIEDTTLYANYAAHSGGGLNAVQSTTYITGTTFYGNIAADSPTGGTFDNHGGGLFLYAGTTHLVNSTISGNLAEESGGGIFGDGAILSLLFMTVADNVADDDGDGNGDGGGVYDGSENPNIVNTILAGNVDKGGEAPNCGGLGVLTYGDNIIKDRGCTIAGGTGTNFTSDPLLGPLADNGGPTDTRALSAGSPAIDRVTNNCKTYQALVLTGDQRGVLRPIGAACDIGAYEAAIVYLPLAVRNW